MYIIDSQDIAANLFIIVTYKSASLTLKYNGLVYADIFRVLDIVCTDNLKKKTTEIKLTDQTSVIQNRY